jgi:hyperosmotically inducible protein
MIQNTELTDHGNKKKFLRTGTVLLLLIAFVSCSKDSSMNESRNNPDNTGHNARDASGSTVVPENQQENQSDLKITQKIRQAIVDDSSLSTNAKNVKVITINGLVTLRGPVKSNDEIENIVRKTESVVGKNSVTNQLEATNN